MKRLLRHFTVAGLAVLLITLGGCDITSLNEDPNNPTTTEPPKLLANAQMDIADLYWDDYASGFWVRYAQYWTTNQYTDADRYQYASSRPGSLNNLWEDYYLALNDLQEIIRINEEEPEAQAAFGANDNQKAIALIMQAWTLKTMTDMWGPIPVDEALQGREEGEFTPSYNTQERAYEVILDKLASASDMIDPSSSALSSGDLMYGGDMSKWKKFANSLRLRAAVTLADRKGDLANIDLDAQINDALASGVFESNADNALLPFNMSAPYQNPFYENYEVSGRDDWAAPESIVNPMNEVEDPRRSAFFEDVDGEFVGFPYGLEQGDAQSLFTSEDFSRPSERVARTPDAPAIFMLYDEVLFIKAELGLRSDFNQYSEAEGQQFYEEALEASARYWGVEDDQEIEDWRDRVLDEYGTPTAGNYKQVMGPQKWIAQYLQGVPGWTTFRRLDFEGVLNPPAGDPGQDRFGRSFAVRMVYPNDEAALNEENLNAAISDLLGGSGASSDNQGVLLWWDTSPPPTP